MLPSNLVYISLYRYSESRQFCAYFLVIWDIVGCLVAGRREPFLAGVELKFAVLSGDQSNTLLMRI